MSVLNRSLFAKSYAQGGLVEESDDTPTAKGYLQSKGIPVTPASLARATDLLTQAQSQPGVGSGGGYFETMPVENDFESPPVKQGGSLDTLPIEIYEDYKDPTKDIISSTPDRWLDAITDPGSMFEMPESIEKTRQAIEDKTRDYYGLEPSKTASVKDTPPSIPSAVTAKPADPIKTVADEINQISTGKSNGKPASKQSGPAMPDFSVSREETMNLRDFADKIGVDLSDPYDAWAYIRDMSAGLLASNDNTFLGALGDAALLSNKNRSTMEAAQKELKAKLAIAKWNNDEDWAKLQYKAKVDWSAAALEDIGVYKKLPGGSKKTSKDSVDTEWFPVTGDVSQLPDHMVRWEGNQAFVMDFTDNEAARLEQRRSVVQTAFDKIDTTQQAGVEKLDSEIDAALMMRSFNGELLLSMKGSDIYNELAADLMESQEEGVRELGSLLDSGDPDADAVSRAIMAVPQVLKQLGGSVRAGIAAGLVPGEYSIIRNEAKRRAKQTALNQAKQDSFTVFDHSGLMTDAIKSTVNDVNFDAPNLQWKYDFSGATTGQMQEMQDTSEDARGVGIFNLAEMPDGYAKGYAPFHRQDENSWINMDQIQLANTEDRNQVHADMGNIYNKLTRAGVDNDKAKWDVIASYDDSNLVAGGEDVPFSGNLSSRYQVPRAWYMEPESYTINGKREDTSDFRDKGIFWNGFTGKWFTFQNERRLPVDLTKQPGVTVGKPKAIGL